MTSDNTTPYLKPCPFCGSEAWEDCSGFGQFDNVCCKNINCGLENAGMSKNAWNNRAENPQPVTDERKCTCHPDDNPPKSCSRKYAYSDCVTDTERQEAWESLKFIIDNAFKRETPYGVELYVLKTDDQFEIIVSEIETIRRALSAPAPQQVDVETLKCTEGEYNTDYSSGWDEALDYIASEYTLTKKDR